MERQFTESEAKEHDSLWIEASRLTSGELHIDGQPVPGAPDFRTRLKLKKASRLYKSVLKINPDNGAAYFFLARIQLRLGDKDNCMDNLLRAQQLEPTSPGIARECVMVAMQLNQVDQAINLARAAVQRIPDDGGLFVNMGVALLVAGRADEAANAFSRATELELDNVVTQKLSALANRVAAREVPCPRSEREIALAIQAD